MSEQRPESEITASDADGKTPSRSSRRVWIVTSTVVVALVIAGGVVFGALAGRDDEAGGDDRCEDSSAKTGVTEPEGTPRDGEVELADSGVSFVKDEGSVWVGRFVFGADLHNTTGLVARGVTVKVTAFNEDGTPITGLLADDRDEPLEIETEIPFIRPGDHFGYGDGGPIRVTKDTSMPELKFDIEVEEWWKVENDVHEFASITADIAEKQEDPAQWLRFGVDSRYCQKVGRPRVAVIYRDSQGNILGGDGGGEFGAVVRNEPAEDLDDPLAVQETYRPGKTANLYARVEWSGGGMSYEDFNVEPDFSKTEIYPYLVKSER